MLAEEGRVAEPHPGASLDLQTFTGSEPQNLLKRLRCHMTDRLHEQKLTSGS